jgi:hypothetical protein
VSDDASGSDAPGDDGAADGTSDGADEWDGGGTPATATTGPPTTGSTPVVEPVPRSKLVGFMAVPITRAVPVRRSTVLMLVAFLGFGTLTYLYPPDGTASSTTTTSSTSNATVTTTTPASSPTSSTAP